MPWPQPTRNASRCSDLPPDAWLPPWSSLVAVVEAKAFFFFFFHSSTGKCSLSLTGFSFWLSGVVSLFCFFNLFFFLFFFVCRAVFEVAALLLASPRTPQTSASLVFLALFTQLSAGFPLAAPVSLWRCQQAIMADETSVGPTSHIRRPDRRQRKKLVSRR